MINKYFSEFRNSNIHEKLISFDKLCDYIPVVSTATNIIGVVGKALAFRLIEKKVDLSENLFITHLKTKSYWRSCSLILLPSWMKTNFLVLGLDIFNYIKSSYCKKTKTEPQKKEESIKDRNIALGEILKDPKNITKADSSLINDKDFILEAIDYNTKFCTREEIAVKWKNSREEIYEHIPENLKNDPDIFFKYSIESKDKNSKIKDYLVKNKDNGLSNKFLLDYADRLDKDFIASLVDDKNYIDFLNDTEILKKVISKYPTLLNNKNLESAVSNSIFFNLLLQTEQNEISIILDYYSSKPFFKNTISTDQINTFLDSKPSFGIISKVLKATDLNSDSDIMKKCISIDLDNTLIADDTLFQKNEFLIHILKTIDEHKQSIKDFEETQLRMGTATLAPQEKNLTDFYSKIISKIPVGKRGVIKELKSKCEIA